MRPWLRVGTRRVASALAVCVLGLVAAGCSDDGGAVTVRWRVVELATGRIWNPASDSEIIGSDGFCCHHEKDANGNDISRRCIDPSATDLGPADWVVQTVEVQLASPDATPTDMGQQIAGQKTLCTAGELTTPFKLPTGRFAVSLSVTATDRTGNNPIAAATPAPEIRDIVAGGIVNLQVIEIAVNPLPTPLRPTAMGVTQ